MSNIHGFLQQSYSGLAAFRTIPSETFWVLIFLFALFIGYFMRQSYKSLKRARLLEDTPTAKIRSAAQGYVELNGIQRMLQAYPTLAPLSHTSCTWYRYTIEFYDNTAWRLVEHGQSSQLFAIDDGTGICVVDPTGAEISTPVVDHWLGYSRYPAGKPSSWISRLFQSFGKYRYTEWTMQEGMPLYAIGHFHTYDHAALTKLYPSLVQTTAETTHVLSRHGLDKRNPLVLSAFDQRKKSRHYRIDAFFWFLAYISLLAGAGWLLVVRFY